MASRVKSVPVVEVNSDERAVASACQFEKPILFLHTIRDAGEPPEAKLR